MFKLGIAIVLAFSFHSCKNSEKKKETSQIEKKDNAPQTTLAQSIEKGKKVYTDFCMQCHLPTGKGIPNNFPPLDGSNWLTEKRSESIHAVKYGQRGAIEVNGVSYNGIMTPMGLSNEEVANVLNYVMNSWGNTQEKMVTVEEVATVEK